MSLKWNNTPSDKTYGFGLNKLNNEESRFFSIYFVDRITGAVLVSNKYSNDSYISDTSEDLISGFLNAINCFIKELKQNDTEEIQEINFNDTRILYERRGRLMCIGITKKTNLQIERSILHQVMKDFYFRFKTQIEQFNGAIAPEILNYKDRLQSIDLNEILRF